LKFQRCSTSPTTVTPRAGFCAWLGGFGLCRSDELAHLHSGCVATLILCFTCAFDASPVSANHTPTPESILLQHSDASSPRVWHWCCKPVTFLPIAADWPRPFLVSRLDARLESQAFVDFCTCACVGRKHFHGEYIHSAISSLSLARVQASPLRNVSCDQSAEI